MVAFAIVVFIIAYHIQKHDLHIAAVILVSALILSSVFAVLFLFGKREKARARRFGLACSNCDQVWIIPEDRKIVIATRHCPHCGKEVIAK
jgi:predicted RNA-binding Zn-ribbon protein involved in translation (DUF1610 family)